MRFCFFCSRHFFPLRAETGRHIVARIKHCDCAGLRAAHREREGEVVLVLVLVGLSDPLVWLLGCSEADETAAHYTGSRADRYGSAEGRYVDGSAVIHQVHLSSCVF